MSEDKLVEDDTLISAEAKEKVEDAITAMPEDKLVDKDLPELCPMQTHVPGWNIQAGWKKIGNTSGSNDVVATSLCLLSRKDVWFGLNFNIQENS
jgi:hypothetical protein